MVYVAVALALSTYLKHIDNTNTATERGKHVANIPTHCHCTATATWHCTATTIARPRQSRVNQFSQSRDSVGTNHVTIRRSIKCCAVLLSQHCLPISSNASTKYKVQSTKYLYLYFVHCQVDVVTGTAV